MSIIQSWALVINLFVLSLYWEMLLQHMGPLMDGLNSKHSILSSGIITVEICFYKPGKENSVYYFKLTRKQL